MKGMPVSALILALGPVVLAQGPPVVKWRGALWGSAAASNRQAPAGALFLRGMDAGEGQLALDGLLLGADVTLAEGWAFKATVLGGQAAKVLSAAGGESGSLTWPEAMLVWTGGRDTIRFGRMYTFMGMEYLDHTQDLTASRGLLFTYAIPLDQVGFAWRHAFSPAWSADLWIFNGENRVQDNNRGKTVGLGLNYNHGGSQAKYLSVMAYRGAEQDGFGAAANSGAEGRMRTRATLLVGWDWGATTLLGEADWAQETLPPGTLSGASAGEAVARWSGAGLILRRALDGRLALVLRLEALRDDQGFVLAGDPAVAGPAAPTPGFPRWALADGAGLRATSAALGLERKWGPTFTRAEVRWDGLNREVADQEGRRFRSAISATWSLGTSF